MIDDAKAVNGAETPLEGFTGMVVKETANDPDFRIVKSRDDVVQPFWFRNRVVVEEGNNVA